jgi:hypothetical protein
MPVRFLTNVEAQSWCLANRVRVVSGEPELRSDSRSALKFRIPEDAGARVSLGKILYPTPDLGEVLIWTTNWSVWPSGEHAPLMVRLREALGEKRALDVAPAQLVDSTSADDGQSLLILNLLFLWDCWVISSRGEYSAGVSHDEWGELYIAFKTKHAAFEELFRGMNLLIDSNL